MTKGSIAVRAKIDQRLSRYGLTDEQKLAWVNGVARFAYQVKSDGDKVSPKSARLYELLREFGDGHGFSCSDFDWLFGRTALEWWSDGSPVIGAR